MPTAPCHRELQSRPDVGHALGFSEPTNFNRFFVRLVGTTPLGFRGRYIGGRDSGR